MASVSSTSSLGNTALRGYGGMASGIDRDAIIEQMTSATNTKIWNQESAITKLEWKQEAYRGVSDKILDLYDNYCSYTSTTSLKDPNTFAKSLISVIGKDDVTKFISATGSSDLVDSVSVKAVKQIATSTVRQSKTRQGGKLEMELKDLQEACMYRSHLVNAQLWFKKKEGDDTRVLQMPTSYEVEEEVEVDGKTEKRTVTKEINYFIKDVPDKDAAGNIQTDANGNTIMRKETAKEYGKRLAEEINKALEQKSTLQFNVDGTDKPMSECIEFSYVYDETTQTGKMKIIDKGLGDSYEILAGSTALAGLGYTGEKENSISISQYNDGLTKDFQDAALTPTSALEYLKGEKLTFNLDGNKKNIELITQKDADELKDKTNEEALPIMQKKIQDRLDQAFGKDKIKVDYQDGKLTFETSEKTSTVSVTCNDGGVLYNLGISNGASNKVNLNGTLSQSSIDIDFNKKDPGNGKQIYEDGLVINDVKIDGIDANTSISSILSKINSNEKVGVKATYVDATGQFMLVSTETGASREINLNSQLAKDLFGQVDNDKKYQEKLGVTSGQDAIVTVSYGNGVDIDIQRASNTFNLEGLSVTVSGTFGGEWGDVKEDNAGNVIKDKDGNEVREWNYDSSEAVSFSAKADVDKVVEKVKKFFEDFNAIVTEVNTQVTTRPDSSYGPLTDEQKDEMSETSIENWEKKAKSGLLFNDSTMRDLSMDIQSVYTKLMSQTGLSYEDLKELGISYSDNEKDGGVLVFDENAFRSAMESKPDKVSSLFTGGNGMGQGIVKIVEDTFTPYATRYATRNGNSYGRLIEEAGSEKIPTSIMKNQIYNEIKSKQELIESLRAKLKTEEDRYISMFTTMETMINKMNSQASYLSQITG